MIPVHEKIPQFNLSNVLSKGRIIFPDIMPTDNPVCSRMIMIGKCFVWCNRKHEKITDSHARRIYDKLKGTI